MSADAIRTALARRAVACPTWRWEVGMLAVPDDPPVGVFVPPRRVLRPAVAGVVWFVTVEGYPTPWSADAGPALLPCLSDRATLLLLVGQARDAILAMPKQRQRQSPVVLFRLAMHEWVRGGYDDFELAEAAVKALEAVDAR